VDDTELLMVEYRLRAAFEGTDLEWVLDEVDTAIAEGIPEERILRRRNRKSRPRDGDVRTEAAEQYTILNYREIDPGELEASRKSGTLVITTRTMTVRERVLLLLDAVRRVIIEVPSIEAETLHLLKAGTVSGDRWSSVHAAVFEPDEGSRRRRDRQTRLGDRIPSQDRARISALFAVVREEVGDE
jgi:hypothetical protein